MDNHFFNSYPYTDFHELNLSWVISELRSFATTLEQFVSINALKYADPIQWNITTQYEKNTIVIDPQTGTAYISVAPVPSGVSLTNTDYWTVVFDLGSFVVRAAQNFTNRWEEETTSTATFSTNAGEWLVWGDVLYRAKVNITAGDTYVVDGNIEHITMEEIIGHLEDLTTTDKSNLVAAINEVMQLLVNTTGDLNDLTTTDKSNLVAAINEVIQTLTDTTGDLDDLSTTDKSNLVAAINEVDQDISDTKQELEELIYQTGLTTPKILTGNLILEDIRSNDYTLQGCCYVGNNIIVAYLASNVSDTGILVGYDTENYTKVFENPIQGYHGNSLCYRPADNCVYICGMAPVGLGLFNTIVVVDMDNPSVVARTITPPVATLYSIAYDATLDKFYSINERGTTPGVANLLYAYNGIFDSIDYTVQLDLYPATYAAASSQGVCFAKDGIVYYFGYVYKYPFLIGADARTGKAVLIAQTPDFVNEYRECGEEQQIMYDFDNDRYLMGSISGQTGLQNMAINMFYEIDLFKSITAIRPAFGTSTKYAMAYFTSDDTYLSSLKPYDGYTISTFKTPQDVLNVFRYAGMYGDCIILNSLVYHLDTVGYSGQITGQVGNHAKLERLTIHGGSDIRFRYCDFTGKFTPVTNYNAQVQVNEDGRATFNDCIFEDYTADATNATHIYSNAYGNIRISNCTFDGSKQHMMVSGLTEAIDEDSLKWHQLTGSVTPATANTYVLADISFTVPANEIWEAYVHTTWSGNHATGVVLSSSNSSVAANSHVAETDGLGVQYSPIFILTPGTYYLWLRCDTTNIQYCDVFYKTEQIR